MSYYVAAYDTEGVFPWWDRERRQRGFSYTPEHITEFLNGVRAGGRRSPASARAASFFLVAKMLELAGPELRAILDNPLFDIQCHSFTHPNLIALGDDRATLQYELGDAKKLIEDTFGRAVTGLTAPGGYTDGFRGHPHILDVMWEPVTATCAVSAKGQRTPCLRCWISPSGMRRMASRNCWKRLRMPGTTTSSPDSRQPCIGRRCCLGPIPPRCPATRKASTRPTRPASTTARKKGLLYYLPIFHPWSIYRIDNQAAQIGLLLDHARQQMEFKSCSQIYQHILSHPELVTD